jgi:hypothetical protein
MTLHAIISEARVQDTNARVRDGGKTAWRTLSLGEARRLESEYTCLAHVEKYSLLHEADFDTYFVTRPCYGMDYSLVGGFIVEVAPTAELLSAFEVSTVAS